MPSYICANLLAILLIYQHLKGFTIMKLHKRLFKEKVAKTGAAGLISPALSLPSFQVYVISTLLEDSDTEETSGTTKEAKALTKFELLSVAVAFTLPKSPKD